MNRDDIIRMAREAGGSIDDPSDLLTLSNLERFAALVVAAEREECVKAVETTAEYTARMFEMCIDSIRARSNHD